jgi:CheY-like chemotaxis protein
MSNKIRILIVENDQDYLELERDLISAWGYEPFVATGKGDGLLQDAVHKAFFNRCQVALVDMRLRNNYDVTDISGLDVIKTMAPARVIVVSGYGDQRVARKSIREKGAESFVGKQEGPEALQEELEKVLSQFSAEKRGLKVGPADVLERIAVVLNIPAEYGEQVEDIFALLFGDHRHLEMKQLGHEAVTSNFGTVPRPRSVVLEVRADGLQPVIAKLARRRKIKIEQKNFKDFVENRLLGHKYASIQKADFLWDVGGAVYTMLGSGFQPFSQYFEGVGIADIEFTLTKFFEETWSPLYAAPADPTNPESPAAKFVPPTYSLFELYSNVWGREWFQRIQEFNQMPAASLMDAPRREKISPPDSIEWIQRFTNPQNDRSIVPGTQVAITHGDLHGDNLLIDDNRHAWVIDFERSGWGPILQDFVELESDLINRLTCSDDNFPAFYELCLRVASCKTLEPLENVEKIQNMEIQKILHTISILRKLARKCTDTTDAWPYLIGLLFNTLFRATIVKGLAQQRALMLASILCHRLDHWDEPWPPKNW